MKANVRIIHVTEKQTTDKEGARQATVKELLDKHQPKPATLESLKKAFE